MIDWQLLRTEATNHPYTLLFATISGAHLYGFPSPDSDYDLRGVHILPVEEAVGLLAKQETMAIEAVRKGIELDLVTHDVFKFFSMLLKRNGYVLEQLYSPLVVQTGVAHDELKEIAKGCITRNHSHHYLGFAATQWDLFRKENYPRVKPILYVYRVLLTGIHLMRTGRIEADLTVLNQEFNLDFLPDLIARKIEGPERSTLAAPEIAFHQQQYESLVERLERAAIKTHLPVEPTTREALNDLLVRVRLGRV